MSHNLNDFHPTIGWVLRPHLRQESGLFTTEYGIRVNDPYREDAFALPLQDSILAVGDSFVAGSEVAEHETWPAHLEHLLGWPVLNAGVGAYGVDQTFLRASELIPFLKPKHILFGILESDVERCGFSHYGAPKPWIDRAYHFRTEHLHGPSWRSWFKWNDYRRCDNSVVDALDYVLAHIAKAWNVPTTIVLQQGAAFNFLKAYSPFAQAVINRAAKYHLPLISEGPTIWNLKPNDYFASYVVHSDGQLGHMSSSGNALVAQLIASEVRL